MPERSYAVFGTVPWDVPWLTEHNLAAALARRHRALYVEPPTTPLAPFRYGLRADTPAKLVRVFRRAVRRRGAVEVFCPLAVPPLEHPLARRVSTPPLRRQIRRGVARAGISAPVVLTTRPAAELAGAAGERLHVHLVKDWVAAGGALLGRDADRLMAEELRACRAADLVCVTSRQLQATLAELGIDSTVLRHGFHSELAPQYDVAPVPAEYAQLPGPRIGYAGRIDARLDFSLLATLADRSPDASIVLIGPVSPRLDPKELALVAGRPNVHLLGARPREALPGFLRHLDCSLMPYRADEWLKHASPLKLWDCLYAGPPVVGTGCLALLDYPPPLARFARDADELVEAVHAAVGNGRSGREERRAFALANSWDARAAQLDQLVSARLSG